jgi:hypothetical protein
MGILVGKLEQEISEPTGEVSGNTGGTEPRSNGPSSMATSPLLEIGDGVRDRSS